MISRPADQCGAVAAALLDLMNFAPFCHLFCPFKSKKSTHTLVSLQQVHGSGFNACILHYVETSLSYSLLTGSVSRT